MSEEKIRKYLVEAFSRFGPERALTVERKGIILARFLERVGLRATREACLAMQDQPDPSALTLYRCLGQFYWEGLLVFLRRLPKSLDGDSLIRNLSLEWDPAAVMAIDYLGGWDELCISYIQDKGKAKQDYLNAVASCVVSATYPVINKVKGVHEAKRSWEDAYVLTPEGLPDSWYRKLTEAERLPNGGSNV